MQIWEYYVSIVIMVTMSTYSPVLVPYCPDITLGSPQWHMMLSRALLMHTFWYLLSLDHITVDTGLRGLTAIFSPLNSELHTIWQRLPKPSKYIGLIGFLATRWRHQEETLPRYWPFVRGIHRPPVNSSHKAQRRGDLMFSLICAWISGWVNNREAGDLRRHRAHYDVIVINFGYFDDFNKLWCSIFDAQYIPGILHTVCALLYLVLALQWRHNKCDDVLNPGVSIVFSTVCSGVYQR